ncbi:hypothetical protein KAZ66_01400 [Candidatus Woesebacteria bacterium]|nr:hypothetical protein [Candidatus Woesebacteria bacterium]
MELEVVSKKTFIFCLFFSVAVIGYHFISLLYVSPNYAYICNEKKYLDILIHAHNTDSIVRPKNIKNTLMCAGRGMVFYDRTIEYIKGNAASSLVDALSKRYKIGIRIQDNQSKNSSYECLRGKKSYLVLQKSLEINTLDQAVYACKPDIIIMQKAQGSTMLFKALKSRKITIKHLDEGEYMKINL